jgi:hypothetical protein
MSIAAIIAKHRSTRAKLWGRRGCAYPAICGNIAHALGIPNFWRDHR